MNLKVAVTKIVEIIKTIQKEPEQLFEIIRIDTKKSIGWYLTAMMEADNHGE